MGTEGEDRMLRLPVQLLVHFILSMAFLTNKCYHSIRRIKCDEQWPRCKRCTSSGRVCNGFERDTNNQSNQKKLNNPKRLLCLQPSFVLAPRSVVENLEERQMISFFHTNTTSSIGNIFDLEFWVSDLSLATHAYPSVWHACLALGALHKLYIIAADSRARYQTAKEHHYKFSLKHYGAAMNSLIQIAQKPDPSVSEKETLLLSTILFSAICRFQDDLAGALVHVRNGMHMFNIWKFWENTTSNVLSTKSLIPVFSQIQQLLGLESNISMLQWPVSFMLSEDSEEPFGTARDAYFEFQLLQSGIPAELSRQGRVSDNTRAPCLSESCHTYNKAFHIWRHKFLELKKVPQLQEADNLLLKLLHLRQTVLAMNMGLYSTGVMPNSVATVAVYQDMVDTAEQILEGIEEIRQSTMRTCCSFTPSMSTSLYNISARCPDYAIRQRAITLLQRCPRHEGTWDTALILTIAKARIEFEEVAAYLDTNPLSICVCVPNAFVCDEHRVVDLQAEFLTNKKATLVMRTGNDIKRNFKGSRVGIQW